MKHKLVPSLLCVWLLAGLILVSGVAIAQEGPSPAEVLESFSVTANQLEQDLDANTVRRAEIEARRAKMEERRSALAQIAATATAAATPLIKEREALGPPPEDGLAEPEQIREQRQRLDAQIEELDVLAKRAQQAMTRASTLADRLNELRRQLFKERLLQRGPSPAEPGRIVAAWQALGTFLDSIASETMVRVAALEAMGTLIDRLALPVILSLVAIFLAGVARSWAVDRLLQAVDADTPQGKRMVIGITVTLARTLLPVVALSLLLYGVLNSGLVGPIGQQLVDTITEAVAILIGTSALGKAFYAPAAAPLRISRLDDAAAGSAHRWLFALASVVAVDRVIVHGGALAGLSIDGLAVANAVLLIIGGIALWNFLRASRLGVLEKAAVAETEPGEEAAHVQPSVEWLDHAMRAARFLGKFVAVAAPFLALVGYYGASRFVIYRLVVSAALIGICVLIHRVARVLTITVTAEVAEEAEETERRETGLIPVIIGFLLALGAAPLLALIWGADTTDLLTAWSRIVDGFEVGDLRIAPVDFLSFIIVFAVGFVLTRILQGILRRSVLPLTRMDAGAQSAILAGIGYVGIVVAALIAISTTGLDLSNLAIVAGALSVGIGFGLQTVVNNFVSGIILLVERPISVGDWVEVGGIHGTVRKVNVRSTEIETFDRSTMFVPNADLISGTVTNWTHGNSLGRLIVPVGVAYGTDTRKVEKILLEILNAHPMLMRRPEPFVVFRDFGADSLNFEARGVLRDVNWIIRVGSDIRHSIDEKFAEAGIEIPFAQRDLHIKNAGELGAALRGDVKGTEPKSDRPGTADGEA